MKPRRTHDSTGALTLPGGNEDNDLWVQVIKDESGAPVISSVWELSDEERALIAQGANVELLVWGSSHPPVSLHTTTVALGKPPAA